MSIIKIKAVKNLVDFSRYVLDRRRHPREKIIEVNDYKENLDNQQNIIESYQAQKKDRRGKRPRLLSLIIAFKPNTSLDELVQEQRSVLSDFFRFVSAQNDLGLHDEDIQKMVSHMPSVIHYGKNRSGHTHNLINRVLWSRKENRYVNIDLTKKLYHRELMRLSGHRISEKIQNKKDKPLYNYTLDSLREEIYKYKNINEYADKLIAMAEKDLKRGHSQKALKKLTKLQNLTTKG